MQFLALISCLCCLALATPTKGKYEKHKVIRFENISLKQQALLNSLVEAHNLDVWSHSGSSKMDIRIAPELYPSLKAATKTIDQSIWVSNVQDLVDAETKHSLESFDANVFSDYQDAHVYADFLASQPGSSLINLGKTFENRDIQGLF